MRTYKRLQLMAWQVFRFAAWQTNRELPKGLRKSLESFFGRCGVTNFPSWVLLHSGQQSSQAFSYPCKADSLLFQSHPDTEAIVKEVIEQLAFLNGKVRKAANCWSRFLPPKFPMGDQGRAIHQK